MAFGDQNNLDDEPLASINVTPLVDVMLVLLVIFMVTAPMMQQGVEIELPKSSAGPLKSSEEPLVLSVNEKGEVFAGEKSPISREELGVKVGAILKARGDESAKVYIRADQKLSYGEVMKVMGELYKSDIKEVGLVSDAPGIE
jgi:biopolymer transport protein TolR